MSEGCLSTSYKRKKQARGADGSYSESWKTKQSDMAGMSNKTFVIILVGIVTCGVSVSLVIIVRAIVWCIQQTKMHEINARQRNSNPANTSLPTTNTAITSPPQNSTVSMAWGVEVASMEKFLNNILKEKPVRFTPQHLIDFTHNYTEKLGAGGFGVVYKGRFPNGVLVAVKVLHRRLDKRAEEQFMAEVGTIGRTYHINLVRLYGFCFDSEVEALVYEFMEKGSLDQYLFDKNIRLEWGKLHQIATETAKGIRYLHDECQHRIIHYDIKPGNVLLNADFSPKVADFGLAKLCDRENSHVTLTGGRGTPGYAAPELWMPFPVTYKCDVYSFGMMLFEILGRRRNLDFKLRESQEWFPRWVWEKFEQGDVGSIMSLCRVEDKSREMAERMCKVALWCVQYQPEMRPSMNNVVEDVGGRTRNSEACESF